MYVKQLIKNQLKVLKCILKLLTYRSSINTLVKLNATELE